MPDPPTIPEGLDLRKDGTVLLHLDGGHATLRRPKMRELRQLRQMEWDIADGQRAEILDVENQLTKLRDEIDGLSADDTKVDLAHVRDLRREMDTISTREQRRLTDLIGDQRLEWATHVIATLAGRDIDADDLPPWCSTADFAIVLIGHWLAVPTRHGGR